MINRFLTLITFIFPFPRPLTSEAKARVKALNDSTEALINSARWDKSPASALEQAARIVDSEHERRRTAERKATTYLAVLAALVPVTLSIQAAEWDNKTGPAPQWLRLLILVIAVTYTAAAGWNAFKALQVAGIHVIGVHDLAKAWQGSDGPKNLAQSTAFHILASHSAINAKVTSIKVTHAHLIRAFFFFIILLLIDPVTYQLQSIGVISKAKEGCTELCSNSGASNSSQSKERTKAEAKAKVWTGVHDSQAPKPNAATNQTERSKGDSDVKVPDTKTQK